MIQVAFKSPYNPKVFVRVEIPNSFSLQELRDASRHSITALNIIKHLEEDLFETYPIVSSGALGLLILSRTCTKEEEPYVMGMVGAFSFTRQMEERMKKLMPITFDSAAVLASLNIFETKYGPQFYRFVKAKFMNGGAPWRERMLECILQKCPK